MQRFSISSPDLRIDAARRSKQGQSVHRFSISSPDLRIDAAKRSKQEHSLHRFSISGPDLRIDAAKRSKQGQSLQPKGVRHCAAAEECRMGRDFGRRSRPWLREREGPAAQRREGKHRRCAPVRSPCPQAESAAGTAPCPQAAFAQRIPRRQPPPRESPAGRSSRRAETISCGSAAR